MHAHCAVCAHLLSAAIATIACGLPLWPRLARSQRWGQLLPPGGRAGNWNGPLISNTSAVVNPAIELAGQKGGSLTALFAGTGGTSSSGRKTSRCSMLRVLRGGYKMQSCGMIWTRKRLEHDWFISCAFLILKVWWIFSTYNDGFNVLLAPQ
jgi:hypothetical protein